MALSGELIALAFSSMKDNPRGWDMDGYEALGWVYQEGAERGECSPIQQANADLMAQQDES